MIEYILLFIILLMGVYKWITLNQDFFKKRGINHLRPIPLVGNLFDIVFHRKSMFDLIVDFYNTFDTKVFGIYEYRVPLIVLKDPELVRHVAVKNFEHFTSHRSSIFRSSKNHDEDNDNLFALSLLQMEYAKWKDMRSTLSPAFTGKKVREMYLLINKVAQENVNQLKEYENVKSGEGIELDVKDYTTRFTNDIIASTAFGLEVNSIKDKDNEFYNNGKKITSVTTWQTIKFFLYGNFKPLMKLFNIPVFDAECAKYFKNIALNGMKYRQEHNIIRPDMLHMLMEARGMLPSNQPKIREWTETEMVAQCFLFFFAGFETSSTLLCFAAHELMENPEIQQHLYEEVKETFANTKGKTLTYETLQNMKLMDRVIMESLRKWPPTIVMDRVCNKDFVYEEDGERIEFKKGDNIWIPTVGFHRDPKYFPNPTKFDPDRFSDERKDEIIPFTYMPFGQGPRNCIASRFALLEAKALLFFMIKEFRFEAAKKTSIPITLANTRFQLLPKNGFWLKLVPRSAPK